MAFLDYAAEIMALVDALVMEGEKCPVQSDVAPSLTSDFVRVDKEKLLSST